MTYAGPRYIKDAWRSSVRNGKIPATKLAEIEAWPVPYDRDLDGPAKAHPEAAAAMGVLLRQAWEAGHTSLTIAYSYRTFETQQHKWDLYRSGDGNLAAVPGTSNHGWAVAFDMRWGTAAAFNWLHANAGRYGFSFDVRGENWHATLQQGRWGGDDMTKDEKAQLAAATKWNAGDLAYRQAYAKKKKDPGPPPDNWVPAQKQGWGAARFSVQRLAEHSKSHS